ncbi:flagellar hook-length control protein FliK [Paenarthrobacter sp. NPDC089675]|uniref:flagellar hook-length control protein FliK n=1 Tax=Paenarthrobacter sp. NPDC089675 TaxID=3364376 RepID=UPI003804515F
MANPAPSANPGPGVPQPTPTGADAAAQATVVVVPPAQLQAGTQAALAQPASPAHHQPLAQQLAQPLFVLASAKPGEHVMTLRVSPEDLGPLTVRAHIDGAGVRIELFAAGDAGREAVRHVLPELRRGLEDTGASLSLSSQDSPRNASQDNPRNTSQQQHPHHGAQDTGTRHGSQGEARRPVTEHGNDPRPAAPPRAVNGASEAAEASEAPTTSRLDVLV